MFLAFRSHLLALLLICFTSVATRVNFGLVRADALLVSRGLCANRAAAKRAIEQGRVVTRSGAVVRKSSKPLDENTLLIVKQDTEDSDRLRAVVETFRFEIANASVLGVGNSAGVEMDSAMRAGAAVAVAIESGDEVSDRSFQRESGATVLHGANLSDAASLAQLRLPRKSFDLIMVDLPSVMAVQVILPSIWRWLDAINPKARLVISIKPRTKAHQTKFSSKDASLQIGALDEFATFARTSIEDCAYMGSMIVPKLGNKHKEFLVLFAHQELVDGQQRGPYVCSEMFAELNVTAKGTAASRAARAAAAGSKLFKEKDDSVTHWRTAPPAGRRDDNGKKLRYSKSSKPGTASAAAEAAAVGKRTRSRSKRSFG